MKIWNSYIRCIKANCANPAAEIKDLAYWRNNLFAGTIIYLLPFCLIALLPSLYWIIRTGQYILALVDVVTVASMLVVAFLPGLDIYIRKIIFIGCAYIFSCLMLYYVGLTGPGLIFLQTACILCILIFPAKYAWWPALLNTFICCLFAVAVSFQILPWSNDQHPSTGEWITVASNLVFLSFLLAALIPRLFNGIQETILNEQKLRQQLGQRKESLEQAMKMLEQKNNELEQFAYVASHDLQEPLRMITGFLTLLEKKYHHIIDDKGSRYIHFAVDGARRMRQIIIDLLEFSRAGRLDETLEEVDLNELFTGIISLHQKQIGETNAIIKFATLPSLQIHKAPLRQVFQNLLSNSLKYHKKGESPIINICAKEYPTHWLFTFEDNGIGISPEYFNKIFLIFQRLHLKEEYPGTGIGLAICKKIIEAQGGKIWAESGNDTGGTTFYFTIVKS